MELLYLSILSAISILLIFLSFIVGLHYGTKIKNNEEIKVPNPIKTIKTNIKEAELEKISSREQEIEDINLSNIDSYDGSGLGQKEFPS